MALFSPSVKSFGNCDQLYPMKHFYPDRSGLFQDDRLHESQRVTECFDGYKKVM